MKIETLTHNIEYIAEGLQAQDEAGILPVYYNGEIANGAAYTAYRIRRFVNRTGDVAMQAYNAVQQQDASLAPTLAITAGMTAVALAVRFL